MIEATNNVVPFTPAPRSRWRGCTKCDGRGWRTERYEQPGNFTTGNARIVVCECVKLERQP